MFRIPKTLADITASIGSVYLMTVLVLWVFQEHFIYHPTNRVVQQAEIDMESRYVDPWMSPDGEMIGIKKIIVNPKMNYLVFHGNSGEALDRTYIANLLTQGSAAGNVYIMDYPGYGRRSGSPGKKAIFAAVESAVAQLKQENSLPIIVVGESVGSGAATYAAHQVGSKLRAVLLITPYNTMAGVVRKTVPLLPLWLILREDYDNEAMLAGMWAPVFFVLAEQDEVVGLDEGEALYTTYTGKKQKFVVPDVGHNDISFLPDADWYREFGHFLKKTQ